MLFTRNRNNHFQMLGNIFNLFFFFLKAFLNNIWDNFVSNFRLTTSEPCLLEKNSYKHLR